MKDKLSKCLTSLRKSYGTQDLLVTMLEKWKKQLRKENAFLYYSWIFQKPLIQLIMTEVKGIRIFAECSKIGT